MGSTGAVARGNGRNQGRTVGISHCDCQTSFYLGYGRPSGGPLTPKWGLGSRFPSLPDAAASGIGRRRSEEHTSELPSLMRSSTAVFCVKNKLNTTHTTVTQS